MLSDGECCPVNNLRSLFWSLSILNKAVLTLGHLNALVSNDSSHANLPRTTREVLVAWDLRDIFLETLHPSKPQSAERWWDTLLWRYYTGQCMPSLSDLYIIDRLQSLCPTVKQVWYTDDATCGHLFWVASMVGHSCCTWTGSWLSSERNQDPPDCQETVSRQSKAFVWRNKCQH